MNILEKNVLEKIQPIFRDVFDDEILTVTETTAAADVEDCESFAQMQIVVGIEEMFGIKFSTDEVMEFKNVGDIVKAFERHIGG